MKSFFLDDLRGARDSDKSEMLVIELNELSRGGCVFAKLASDGSYKKFSKARVESGNRFSPFG